MRDSELIVLMRESNKNIGLNSGACSYANCEEFEKAEKQTEQDLIGSTCVYKSLDFEITFGSTAKTASIFNIGKRIMYRIRTAEKRLAMLPEATVIKKIPLSAKGKNIYFDRSRLQSCQS